MKSNTAMKPMTCGSLCLLLALSSAHAQTDEQPQENFFETQEDNEDSQSSWDDILKNSFGQPEAEPSESESESAPSPAPAAPTEDLDIEILPPQGIASRLIETSSLPLLVNFDGYNGNPTKWPTGKTWTTGLLPISRTFDLKGCKFHITTGPVSVAHYEKLATEFSILNDSVTAKNTIRPERGATSLYMSANVDLFPSVDPETLEACNNSIKGKIIAIGTFDLSGSAIQIAQAQYKYLISVAERSTAKPVQVYLYWPEGQNEPLLIDNEGLYPVASTPIYEIRLENPEQSSRGNGFLEVVPHLTYEKGGKALSVARLKEIWGVR